MATEPLTFRTIVADPPWDFPWQGWDRPRSTARANYPTLTVEEICSLPVERFVQEDAYLWLWIPTHHLVMGYGRQVAEAWGFRPINLRIWCKPKMGLGNYMRNCHEQVLFGIRNHPGQLNFQDLRSWWVRKPGRHSEKPGDFRPTVEKYCDGPYLELFSRMPRPGWTVWGNEVGDPLGIGFSPEGWSASSCAPQSSPLVPVL